MAKGKFQHVLSRGRLRTRFLLAFAAIATLLTWVTLFVVRYRVQIQVQQEITQDLRNSLATFEAFQSQRDDTLTRSAALLANQPLLKALMTSTDMATIQDASTQLWKLAGSQLFVLADRFGNLAALHTVSSSISNEAASQALKHSLAAHDNRDWWIGEGHVYQVFFQPIYFGAENDTPIGLLGLGFEVDEHLAADVSRVTSSQIAFSHAGKLVVSTVPEGQRFDLAKYLEGAATAKGAGNATTGVQLGDEQFLTASVELPPHGDLAIRLSAFESYDKATAFLASLNRWILALGVLAVFTGSALVYFVSTTFTRPLARLVDGVQALEKGDFEYPLNVPGSDEVSTVTAAFDRMRRTLLETQRRAIEQERMATIGRMASNISHDLRHPLTAILAYAEFLADDSLTETQRKDFFEEIRIAVGRMTDELGSLLSFSGRGMTMQPQFADAVDVIERAVHMTKVLPDFQGVSILYTGEFSCKGWFDPGKLERVVLNLVFNACEATVPTGGQVTVHCKQVDNGLEIRIADTGPGIPEGIQGSLFDPFVSSGKEKGIGLGLTVVQRLTHEHGGTISVEETGPQGTVFLVRWPWLAEPAAEMPAATSGAGNLADS